VGENKSFILRNGMIRTKSMSNGRGLTSQAPLKVVFKKKRWGRGGALYDSVLCKRRKEKGGRLLLEEAGQGKKKRW